MGNPVLFFDGVCNLCNRVVQFVIENERDENIRFAPLQSKAGFEFLHEHQLSTSDFNTFVLLEGDQFYTKSTAALKLLRRLKGGWSALYCLIIVPRFIRDFAYSIVSKNRYDWFGKKPRCMVPTAELQNRFLD